MKSIKKKKSLGRLFRGPKLPVQWFALSLVLQSSGLLCQLLFGWTVISGGLKPWKKSSKVDFRRPLVLLLRGLRVRVPSVGSLRAF